MTKAVKLLKIANTFNSKTKLEQIRETTKSSKVMQSRAELFFLKGMETAELEAQKGK